MLAFVVKFPLDPSPVRNLVAVAINSTAINVTWQPPINPNGDVSYLVSVQGSSVHQINTTNTSVIVTHLEIYTMYYVTVTVGNGAGENSSLYAVRTLESGILCVCLCVCVYVHVCNHSLWNSQCL